MRVNVSELREMIAEAVRQTVREAKKAKEVPPVADEVIHAQRERMTRGLPGYALSKVLDMSKPLGRKSLPKRQGASNMGSWTSESVLREDESMQSKVAVLVPILVQGGVPQDKAQELAKKIVAQMNPATGGTTGLSNPSSLGMESIRKLVRMVVGEEVRVARKAPRGRK